MATYWENSCSFGFRYVSWYKYLIVSFVFSHLGFWSGNLFLIALFPDLCLLAPFRTEFHCVSPDHLSVCMSTIPCDILVCANAIVLIISVCFYCMPFFFFFCNA